MTMTRAVGPCISGIGESAVGVVRGRSSTQLHHDALSAALVDAELTIGDIDGLITCGSMVEKWPRHAMTVAEHFGILGNLRAARDVALGGASGTVALVDAIALVESGLCRNVAVVGADPQLSGLTRDRAIEVMASFRHPEFEAPYGPLNPTCFGLLAQRHAYEHGTTHEQLAQVAVTSRRHAALTGRAHMMEPITVEDVLAAKPVSSPLTMLDCSLISDGGAALIVSAAPTNSQRAVRVAGSGIGYAHHDLISTIRSLRPEDLGAREASTRAFTTAGISSSDIDVAALYDCFTITPILLLESLGICKEGQGGPYVADQGIGLDSPLPVNTHGGLLSYAHSGYPSILFGVVEMVRQLRGSCGSRQVPDATTAVVHGLGGMFSVHCTVVIRGE
jgi:acetyl-CoA acetyltransferase